MESLVHAMLSNAVVATVMAVVVAALARACRRPALIHGLWLVVMLKLITPPVVPVSVPMPVPISTAVPIAVKSEPAVEVDLMEPARELVVVKAFEPPPGELPLAVVEAHIVDPPHSLEPNQFEPPAWRWEHVVLALVMSGAIAWWTLALVRIVRFQRVLRDVRPIPGEWQDRIEELASQIGLAGCPSVSLVPGRVPPMLWAIGIRPRLLLPAELWLSMSDDERTSLLLHELAHLKRRDHWVRWLELIVAGLYWWHPAAWYVRSALREAEEQCCDAWVVWAMPRGSRTYASALLAALEFVSGARTAPPIASATSGNGHVSCLKRRLRMIVRARTPKGLSWAGRLAVLGLAALLLPLAPSWAQDNDKAPTADQAQAQDRLREAIQIQEKLAGREIEAALKTETEALTRLAADDDKDEPKTEHSRELAEGLEGRLQELINKLAKELGPAAEEFRKTLERAAGEVHKSLDKEGVTGDDLAKGIDGALQELRKAFESDGPVGKELREAIERSTEDAREALESAREEIGEVAKSRADALRKEAGELAEREQSKLDSLRSEVDKETTEGGANQPDRQELETARKEIRDLEQQLRRATRRLDQLQQRESRRNPATRRAPAAPRAPVAPRAEPAPRPESAPAAEPKPPVPPAAVSPAAPATPARPMAPSGRRGRPPIGLGPGDIRRGPRGDEDRRLQNLEEKMNQLLKELQKLKSEPKPQGNNEPKGDDAEPISV